MKKKSNYVIGLAIDRNGIGYAVCDISGKPMRFRGKNMWGISWAGGCPSGYLSSPTEFIRQLQLLFSDVIAEFDADFFNRLRGGFIKDGGKASFMGFLANSVEEGKKWRKNYPTIYHLRYQLSKEEQKADLRLVYLALHHILKRGGNPARGIAFHEKHKSDLMLLKKLYRKYAPDRYGFIFRHHAQGCYASYTAAVCTQEYFYSVIRKDLGIHFDDLDFVFCFSEMENGFFLPRNGDLGYYEPPAPDEVSRIVRIQSKHSSFFRQYGERIEELCQSRRDRWLSDCFLDTESLAVKLVREVMKIEDGKPDRIFVTYDTDDKRLHVHISNFLKRLSEVSRNPVSFLPYAVLTEIKRHFGLYDSRAVNDCYPAQNAFLVSNLGLYSPYSSDFGETKTIPCDAVSVSGFQDASALAYTEVLIHHPQILNRIRSVFGFCECYESGIPNRKIFFETQNVRMRKNKEEGKTGTFSAFLGKRILYHQTEYGISAFGEVVSLVQLMLSRTSLETIDAILHPNEHRPIREEEYRRVYEEILTKATRFNPFYKPYAAFSEVRLKAFCGLSSEKKKRWISSILYGLRAGRSCGMLISELDKEQILRIDRSVTGMFEKKRRP